MAAFTLTASGVKVGSDASVRTFPALATQTAGQAITAEGYVVDPNDTDKLGIVGLSVASAASGSKGVVVMSGEVIVTDTLLPQRQIIAAPSGQLQYDTDLLSGDYYVIVGYTKDANTIVVNPHNSGVAKA